MGKCGGVMGRAQIPRAQIIQCHLKDRIIDGTTGFPDADQLLGYGSNGYTISLWLMMPLHLGLG